MSQTAYLLMHLFGAFLTFMALGGITLHVINGGDKASNSARKLTAITFSLGLVLVLVGGFGQLARLDAVSPSTWEGWVYAKFVIWLLIGALYAVPYRKTKLLPVIWIGVPTLGLIAAWLALYMPF
jgi:hypothetical protein